MPLVARVENKELDGNDLLVTTFLSGRISTSTAKRAARTRARAEAGIPVPSMFSTGFSNMGLGRLVSTRTSIEESDLERRGPFVKGTITVRVKNVK